MFKVELVDIGGDGCVTDFVTDVETLLEAEYMAADKIITHIGTTDVELVHDEELVYEVMSGGSSIGVVAIVSV